MRALVNVAFALLRLRPAAPDANASRALAAAGQTNGQEPVVVRIAPAPCPHCLSPLDMVVVLDGSGSVLNAEYAAQQHFVQELAGHWVGGGTAQLGVVAFAEEPRLISPMFGSADVAAALAAASWGRPAGYSSDAAKGLLMAENVLMSGGRQSSSSTVLLFLKGPPVSQLSAETVAGRLRQFGVRVYVVGFGHLSQLEYGRMKELAAFPPEHNIKTFASFDALRSIGGWVIELCPHVGGLQPQ